VCAGRISYICLEKGRGGGDRLSPVIILSHQSGNRSGEGKGSGGDVFFSEKAGGGGRRGCIRSGAGGNLRTEKKKFQRERFLVPIGKGKGEKGGVPPGEGLLKEGRNGRAALLKKRVFLFVKKVFTTESTGPLALPALGREVKNFLYGKNISSGGGKTYPQQKGERKDEVCPLWEEGLSLISNSNSVLFISRTR